MRLSRDGLTEISDYGMKDYFRDALTTINNLDNQYIVEWDLTDDEVEFPSNVFYIEKYRFL